jgi:hypothetical protein
MDWLGSLDSSCDLQANCAMHFLFRLDLSLNVGVGFFFGILNYATGSLLGQFGNFASTWSNDRSSYKWKKNPGTSGPLEYQGSEPHDARVFPFGFTLPWTHRPRYPTHCCYSTLLKQRRRSPPPETPVLSPSSHRTESLSRAARGRGRRIRDHPSGCGGAPSVGDMATSTL